MSLLGLVAVGGKPGLYKLIGQVKSGYIIESFDDRHAKQTINMATAKLAALQEITVYCYDEDARLPDIMRTISRNEDMLPVEKASDAELRAWFTGILPNHDTERVYLSDIKKILQWYRILKRENVDLAAEEPAGDATATEA